MCVIDLFRRNVHRQESVEGVVQVLVGWFVQTEVKVIYSFHLPLFSWKHHLTCRRVDHYIHAFWKNQNSFFSALSKSSPLVFPGPAIVISNKTNLSAVNLIRILSRSESFFLYLYIVSTSWEAARCGGP